MTNQTNSPSINIHGRNLELDPGWMEYAHDRLAALDRFGNRIIAIDLEMSHERNPRRQEKAWRVEIATRVHGHTLLAKGEAADRERAFELARETMEANLRRAARRYQWSRHGRQATMRVSEVLS